MWRNVGGVTIVGGLALFPPKKSPATKLNRKKKKSSGESSSSSLADYKRIFSLVWLLLFLAGKEAENWESIWGGGEPDLGSIDMLLIEIRYRWFWGFRWGKWFWVEDFGTWLVIFLERALTSAVWCFLFFWKCRRKDCQLNMNVDKNKKKVQSKNNHIVYSRFWFEIQIAFRLLWLHLYFIMLSKLTLLGKCTSGVQPITVNEHVSTDTKPIAKCRFH